jgi:uncharacterized membrane protein
MQPNFHNAMSVIGLVLDAVGVALVALGAVYALVRSLFRRPDPGIDRYRALRVDLGRAILLGLEFLIAGDIIRSVVNAPDFTNVGVLALIVLVRTFLSMTLQLEVEGRWPWQRRMEGAGGAAPGTEARSGD